jgi:hypothetical protein
MPLIERGYTLASGSAQGLISMTFLAAAGPDMASFKRYPGRARPAPPRRLRAPRSAHARRAGRRSATGCRRPGVASARARRRSSAWSARVRATNSCWPACARSNRMPCSSTQKCGSSSTGKTCTTRCASAAISRASPDAAARRASRASFSAPWCSRESCSRSGWRFIGVAAFRGYQYFSKAICPGTPRRLVAKPRAESAWRSSRVISGLPQTSTREWATSSGVGCRGFEAAVGEQQRDAVGQRGRARLAGDDRQIGEPGFGLGEQFALRHAGNFVAPGQLRRVAHAVRDDQALIVLPNGGILQDGEEGSEPGAAGEHPELAATGPAGRR